MPITILDYVKSKVGEKDSYPAEDFYSNGVELLGGCEHCHATIAGYNAYPSTSGYWRCADCIGGAGFATVEEFERAESGNDGAISWLLRLRQLQAEGSDFDSALAQANAEAGLGLDSELVVYDPKAGDCPAVLARDDDQENQWIPCPACGGVENVAEIRAGHFKCDDCDAEWTA